MNANQHTHGITDTGHTHGGVSGFEVPQVIVDEAYMGAHLHAHENCRCSLVAIAPEVMEKAARAESEYQLTVKLDPATIDALMDEMRKTIAAAFGMKPERLFGGEAPAPVSREYRALMTVAAFPHTPE
jgi:hypothetical protein